MPAPDDDVVFVGPALEAYLAHDAKTQAELAAIARGLFYEPFMDGETKFVEPVPYSAGVSVYERVYRGQEYWMYYEYDGDPVRLTVLDWGRLQPLA